MAKKTYGKLIYDDLKGEGIIVMTAMMDGVCWDDVLGDWIYAMEQLKDEAHEAMYPGSAAEDKAQEGNEYWMLERGILRYNEKTRQLDRARLITQAEIIEWSKLFGPWPEGWEVEPADIEGVMDSLTVN